jgi:hypothetical protein
MQQDIQTACERREDEKQPYERPRIGKVRLYADRVLACTPNNIDSDNCSNPDVIMS